MAAMLMRLQQPINNDRPTQSGLPAPHDRPAHRNSDLDPATTPTRKPCRLSFAPRDFKWLTSPARCQVASGQWLAFAAQDRRTHERRVRNALILRGRGEKIGVRLVGNYARHGYAHRGACPRLASRILALWGTARANIMALTRIGKSIRRKRCLVRKLQRIPACLPVLHQNTARPDALAGQIDKGLPSSPGWFRLPFRLSTSHRAAQFRRSFGAVSAYQACRINGRRDADCSRPIALS